MANVLLTQKCVRNCPYCFAKEQMQNEPDDLMTWDNLIYIADLHEKSKIKHISLLGGEPTLHPSFVDFVAYLIDRNFIVNIFTSGVLSNKTLEDLKLHFGNFNEKQLSFVCNVNAPEDNIKNQLERVYQFLQAFGKFTSCGFNIYKPNFDLSFIANYIEKYNLKKRLRIGLTHPILGEKNIHLVKEKMQQMADNFMLFVPMLEEKGISTGFDCGMPLCLFSDESIGKLFKANAGDVRYKCGPAIDIGPDMEVWSCFPLSNYKRKSFYDFDSMHDIRKHYEDIHREVRGNFGGIFNHCNDCNYFKTGLCSGGCLSHVIQSNLK